MWQRFTERARRVILIAQEEAGTMGSDHVGSEHILLGIVVEDEGVGAQLLLQAGVTAEVVREAIKEDERPQPSAHGEPKLTSGAKRVLELSADEARRIHHNYIGTEHLLLGLLREKSGMSKEVLDNNGLTLEEMRRQVAKYAGVPGREKSEEASGKVVSRSKLRLDVTPKSQALLASAARNARFLGSETMSALHIVQVVLQDENGVEAKLLRECGLDIAKALLAIDKHLKTQNTETQSTEKSDDV